MSIEAEDITSWLGSDAVDRDGERLGKITDIFFHDATPVLAQITSGRIGHKYYLTSLADANVAPDFVRLGAGPVAQTGRDITTEDLETLSQEDPRVAGIPAGELESLTARQERLAAAQAAAAQAAELEAEAHRRLEIEQEAAAEAETANRQAQEAHRARVDADQAATDARAEADALQ